MQIDFKKYAQKDLIEWSSGRALYWDKKNFFNSIFSLTEKAVENGEHLKLLNCLIFLTNYYEENENGTNYCMNKVKLLWKCYFESFSGDSKPLIFALSNLNNEGNFISEKCENYWIEEKKKNFNKVILSETKINEYIKNCEYKKSSDANYLGELKLPHEKKEKYINPFDFKINYNLGEAITKIKENIFEDKKEKELLYIKENISKFEKMPFKNKRDFLNIYLINKIEYKTEIKVFISEINRLCELLEKKEINNYDCEFEFNKLNENYLPKLVNFIELWSQKNNNEIKNQLNLITKIIIKIKENIEDDINHEIKVQNRFLKQKND